MRDCGEDEHQEAESVLPVYHVSSVNACVQLYLSLMLLCFVTQIVRIFLCMCLLDDLHCIAK